MIDLRSDTVTKPTEAMRRAAYEAEVGDDVYGEDPTVTRLEEKAAELLGKEKALFVTSGTQGNQIAALTHCRPGDEVILEASSHIYIHEVGGFSTLANVQIRPIPGINGAMDPVEVKNTIRSENIHYPTTSLVCIENTHNLAGGAVLPLSNMQAIYQVAKVNNLQVHLDGARLFNAQVASGISVKEYAKNADTVQFCLSKGLGAPVGSIIAGTEAFIKRARKWRKMLGGGLRQVGIIAAPGLVALEENIEQLAEDHAHARIFAEGLATIDGIRVENKVETNIIIVNVKETEHTPETFVDALKSKGILAGVFGLDTVRFVTHYDVSREDIDKALIAIQAIV
ncbi:low-specificity L-threonine aldolase [Paucisalibacillus globulus]|uniref:low-specificity L-threonine aldolase n=1 Tax=Paucisalibacillus globulus TaxID=351095 RepID=UPI0004290828|nr:low-specificity L-threonine aldolase [Paucisalibacillus globulus]